MPVPKTKQDLDRMIADGVEENISLDYKAADSLQNSDGKKKEIAKDVSAMANSAGGVIIYGIKEYDAAAMRHLPESITPIDRTTFSKEQLEQIINSNISPKIADLVITPIPITNSRDVVYIVEIPQGKTAHQNTRDQRYYKRFNFESIPMLDHEIRDILNRQTHPIVEIRLEIEKRIVASAAAKYRRLTAKPESKLKMKINSKFTEKYTLKFWAKNDGESYAKYVNYFVNMPKEIVSQESSVYMESPRGFEHVLQFNGDNTHRDVVGSYLSLDGPGENKYGPSRFDPILPLLSGKVESLELVDNLVLDDTYVSWTVYADNAPPNSDSVRLDQIRVRLVQDDRVDVEEEKNDTEVAANG